MLIAGAGPLHEPKLPDVPGLAEFEGTLFHSATWDHDHDLAGERVAVVGTGASAIQFVPQIQPEVERLHLFQRTAPWMMPRRRPPPHPSRAGPLPPLPGAPARGAGGDLLGAGRRSRFRCCGSRSPRCCARSACAHAPPGPRPRAAREADPGLPAGLQADPGRRTTTCPRSTQPNVELLCDRIAEVRGRTDGRRRRQRARGRHDHLRHRLSRPRHADRRADRRRRRPHARRALGRQPAGPSRHHGRRAFRTSSSCSGRTPGSATTRSSTWPRRRPATSSRALDAHARARARGRRATAEAQSATGTPRSRRG